MGNRRMVLAVVAATLLAPSESPAQGIIRLNPVSGSLAVGYDGYNSSVPGTPGSNSSRLQERLSVRFTGSIYNQQAVAFDVTMQPAFTQGWWSGPQGSQGDNRNGLYGNAALEFMRGGDVQMNFRAFRTRETYNGPFDQRMETAAEGVIVSGNFRSPFMSVAANFDANESDSRWLSSAALGSRRLQKRNQLLVTGSNTKTRVQFQRLETADVIRNNNFLRYRTLGTNRQRWGKGSTLVSRFNYLQQRGAGAVENFTWGQTVNLRHTRTVSTNLTYTYNDVKTPRGFSKGWTAGLNEVVAVNRNATVTFAALGDTRTSEIGKVQNLRLMPRVQTNVPLPAGLQLGLGGGVGYQWRNQETGEGGMGSVSGEEHAVPPSGRFLLDQFQPDPTTVRITSEDGSILYDEGLDYWLFDAGAHLEVVIIRSGQIQVGDVLLVDYQFRVLPTASGEMLRWEYNVSVSVGGFQAYHSLSADEKLGETDSGIPLFGFTDNAIAGARFDSRTPIGALSVNGEWRRTAFDAIASEVFMLEASLGFQMGRRWQGGAGMGYSVRRDGFETTMFHALARVSWTPIPRTRVYARLRAHQWDRAMQGERFLGGAVGADWKVGLLSAGIELQHSNWDISRERGETRVEVRLKRIF
jgi:hypothetical protein